MRPDQISRQAFALRNLETRFGRPKCVAEDNVAARVGPDVGCLPSLSRQQRAAHKGGGHSTEAGTAAIRRRSRSGRASERGHRTEGGAWQDILAQLYIATGTKLAETVNDVARGAVARRSLICGSRGISKMVYIFGSSASSLQTRC